VAAFILLFTAVVVIGAGLIWAGLSWSQIADGIRNVFESRRWP